MRALRDREAKWFISKEAVSQLERLLDEEPWTPRVGDRVRGSRDEWLGLTGKVMRAGDGWADVDWEAGQKFTSGNEALNTHFSGSFSPAQHLEPAGYLKLPDRSDDLVAPEGVTLRYVTAEELAPHVVAHTRIS